VKLFEEAQLNFKKSNFFKAIDLFELSLRKEPLSIEQKILSCESIQKINESLNRPDTKDQLLLLGQSYLGSKHFEKAAKAFESLYKKTGDLYYIERQYLSLIESGLVEEALHFAHMYLEELAARRLTNDIHRFLKENISLLDSKTIALNSLKAMVLSGDRVGLEKEIQAWKLKANSEREELTQAVIDLTSHNTRYWHASDLLLQEIWSHLMQNTCSLLVSKKWLAKFVMDYWLTQDITHEVIEGTVILAKKFSLSILGHELAKFLGDEKLADNFLMSMPREALMGDNFDFAKDLLDENIENEELKIVKNIKFFLSTKNKADALREAYHLEKISPEHPLVRELLPLESSRQKVGSQQIVSDLLSEIGRYTELEHEQYDFEASFISMVKFYADEVILKDHEDMAIGFNLLGMPKVSLAVLARVQKALLSESEKVNFHYIHIETLMKNEDYYKARDLIEDVLGSTPLVPSEKLTFLYLRAEAYFFLGFLSIALSLYREVKGLEHNYRLTEERIGTIEKNQ